MTDNRILNRHGTKMAGVGLFIALTLAGCGGSSGEDEGRSPATDEAVGETVAPDPGNNPGDASTTSEGVSPAEAIAAVSLLDPALEIEIGPTDEPKSIAVSPDGTLVAVLGGGPFREVDTFLKVYDTATGELTNDISIDEATSSVGRIYWTADNRLIGLDTISFDAQVVTWDGATFEFVDSFVMDEFVCLDSLFGFDQKAGAIYARSGNGLCRRELGSDTVFGTEPLDDGQDLESVMLLADGSALVAEVWDSNAQQYLLVRFDPATLELTDSEVLDPNRLEAAGVGVELIEASDSGETGDRVLSLQPSGVTVLPGLDRPRFSPDGSLLWAVKDEAELLIDVATGELIGRFELGRGHLYYGWSADGSVLVNPTLGTTLQVFRP